MSDDTLTLRRIEKYLAQISNQLLRIEAALTPGGLGSVEEADEPIEAQHLAHRERVAWPPRR